MSAEIVEVGPDAAASDAKPKSKKKLIVAGAAAAVLLLGGGGGAFFFLSGGGKAHAETAEAEAPAEGGEAGADSYYDVPALVVNLRSPDGQARFLKVHLMLVRGNGVTDEAIKAKLPAILDSYQPFLRELRPEDLAGSAAVFRIKEELLVRATQVAGSGMVKEVLIQDLVQQ
ncbi:MAG: flagellar basal body-associated FliL family protein [Sphingomonas sp.]|uniref:flagellar basal body-associated FliL family protein n=1 Tax=Sphingomonas sp. TaxID=28214 RepID=UPI001B22F1B4|nr:flagellar basal body-associated FliL family protein [Sphingomonas sp.]MBO9623753.1 flagellar basal body-associated FliL family protein [Sphingomonas sp.]